MSTSTQRSQSVDDEWLTVGSANLNEHSLFNDTEVNLVTDDATLARSVREQLWSEHLAFDCSGSDPLEVIEFTVATSRSANPRHIPTRSDPFLLSRDGPHVCSDR